MDEVAPAPYRRPAFLRMPATEPGKRAVVCFCIVIAAWFVGVALAGTWFGFFEPEGGDIESPPIGFLVPMVLGVLTGGAASVMGAVFAVLALRRGDRSLLLVLPLLAASWVLLFLGGEFLIGHD